MSLTPFSPGHPACRVNTIVVFQCIFMLLCWGLTPELKAQISSPGITTPEVDPRQYIVIYDWKVKNQNKIGNRRFERLDKDKFKVRLNHFNDIFMTLEIENKINRLSNNERSYENLIRETTNNKILKMFYKYQQLKVSDSIGQLNSKLAQLKLLQPQHIIHDSVKKALNSIVLPYDYFDQLGGQYPDILANKRTYYNEAAWRNGGELPGEPIWWLNFYPWEDGSYRNTLPFTSSGTRMGNQVLLPFQKYRILDKNAVLRIVFDKDQFADNEHFKGTITIEAELVDGQRGQASTRAIEVNPLTEIGKKKKSISLGSQSTYELAKSILGFLFAAREKSKNDISYSYRPPQYSTLMSYKTFLSEVIDLENKGIRNGFASKDFIQPLKILISKYLNVLLENNMSYFKSFNDSLSKNQTITDIQLSDFFGKAKNEYNKSEDTIYNQAFLVSNMTSFEIMHADTTDMFQIFQYLKYFKNLGSEQEKIFTYLMGKPKSEVNYEVLLGLWEEMRKVSIKMRELKSTDEYKKSSNTAVKLLNEYYLAYITLYSKLLFKLEALTDIRNSPIEYVSNDLYNTIESEDFNTLFQNGNIRIDELDSIHFHNITSIAPQYISAYKKFEKRLKLKLEGNDGIDSEWPLWAIKNDREAYALLLDRVAKLAGTQFYQDLFYATIDLDKADAKKGDHLSIRLKWINDSYTSLKRNDTSGTDAQENLEGLTLSVAEFDIDETGWKFDAGESPGLVKRWNEGLVFNSNTLVRNNFKLTGGARMYWQYNNDHRYRKEYRFDKNTLLPEFTKNGELKYNKFSYRLNKILKEIEPSFGFQAQYLDFTNAEPSFELGVGPSIGLFDNFILLNAGVNLMQLGNRPYFYSVGFSFGGIANVVKDLNKTQ